MQAESLLYKAIRRGARHMRLLALCEGVLALLLFVGWFFFLEVAADHVLILSAATRISLLLLLAAGTVAILVGRIALPVARSISRLYVARRVEMAFPDFKNSLVTYIQLSRSRSGDAMLPLVAHQAARGFQGVDVDNALDSTRFVRLGYAFVALSLLVFAYSILSPKSMWTSFVRAAYPWESIPAPTRVHIRDVQPGSVRIPQGSDLAVSARISGGKGADASIKWTRDGDLWQSVPMVEGEKNWLGTLSHLEGDVTYYVAAGDAVSPSFSVSTLTPPVVQSVLVNLVYPEYTRLRPMTVADGNIEAPAGTRADITISSNKDLNSAALKLPGKASTVLSVSTNTARGSFTPTRSGRYSIHLTDTDDLQPSRPVEYDVVVLPDQPPKVFLAGPEDGSTVGLDDQLPFRFSATDDYGLTAMVFHFETNVGNENVKNFTLPGDKQEAVRDANLIARLLGARPGDTVKYYLEAVDNREKTPNTARTPLYSFIVSAPRTAPLLARSNASREPVPVTESTLPGDPERATGTPRLRDNLPSRETGPGDSADDSTPREDSTSSFLKMLEKDKKEWDTIAGHFDRVPPIGGESAARGDESPERRDSEADGQPSQSSSDLGGEVKEDAAPGEGDEASSERGTGIPANGDAGDVGRRPSAQDGPDSSSSEQRGASGEDPSTPGQAATPTGGPGQESLPQGAATQGQDSDPRPARRGPAGGKPEDQGEQESVQALGNDSSPLGDSDTGNAREGSSGDDGSQENPSGSGSSVGGSQSPSDEGSGDTGPASGDSPGMSDSSGAGPQGAESASPSPGSGSSGQGESGGQPGSQAQTDSPETSSSSGAGPSGGKISNAESAVDVGPGTGSSGGRSTREAASEGSQGGDSDSGSSGLSPGQGSSSSQSQASGEADSPGGEQAAESRSNSPGGQSSGAGSNGKSGGPERTGRVVDEDAPVPERVARDDFDTQSRIEATRKLVDDIILQQERGAVDRELLVDLGWTPGQLRSFVRKYEAVLETIESAPSEAQVSLESDLDSGDVITGRRSSSSVGRIDAEGSITDDAPEALRNLPREEVSPQYRQLVDEYYRSLTRSPE